MPTIAADDGALASEIPARWEGVARWLRGDGTEVAFLWQLGVRDGVRAGLDGEELNMVAVSRALTYTVATRGAVAPAPGERLTIRVEDVRAALEAGRGTTLTERVADVPEQQAQRAWLVTADLLTLQGLVPFSEYYLRLADAIMLGRSEPPPFPGARVWEVRAFGNLTYFGTNLANPVLHDWEKYEIPLVRASTARVIGLAP